MEIDFVEFNWWTIFRIKLKQNSKIYKIYQNWKDLIKFTTIKKIKTKGLLNKFFKKKEKRWENIQICYDEYVINIYYYELRTILV